MQTKITLYDNMAVANQIVMVVSMHEMWVDEIPHYIAASESGIDKGAPTCYCGSFGVETIISCYYLAASGIPVVVYKGISQGDGMDNLD